MRLWIVVALVAGGGACTRHNPRACDNGVCTDPAHPFCDVEGNLGGVENECIAVTCAANEFAQCRGNTEVRCNAAGDNYDVTNCERVCDSALGGCRLCDANESACTNSTYATCDANGTIIGATPCKLGCLDTTRCKEIVASNGLSMFRDMVQHPGDLDLSAGARIDTTTGTIDVYPDGVPNFLVAAPSNGAPIRVFVAQRVRLGNITFNASTSSAQNPAIAIIATDEITVEGTISLGGTSGSMPGNVSLPDCSPGDPAVFMTNSGTQTVNVAAGGGGHATAGGKGGDFLMSGNLYQQGGAGGAASGTTTLVPLRGGCGSQNVWGGGAIQLTSNAAIKITGTIDVRGAGGVGYLGGGAGGGILLEAPMVELGDGARLLATGGGGGSKDQVGQISDDLSAALGGQCTSSANCGVGGNGAAPGTAATSGGDVTFNTTDTLIASGAGGGGLGRVRINTVDTTYMSVPNAIAAAAVTTGMIAVR